MPAIARPLKASAAIVAVQPRAKKNGATGKIAPVANSAKDEAAAA